MSTAGCRITLPRHTVNPEVHAAEDVAVNSEQIRLRMRALVQPMSGVIISAADKIITGTTNRSIQRQALLWKIEAVPALREALFQPNPITAIVDSWILTFQMIDYFETGPGREELGDAHLVAVNACQQLENEFARIAASLTISSDVSRARAFGKKWAAEHPIRQSIASRESSLSRATEQDMATSFSTMEAVGSVAVTVDDLNRRLEIYSAQLLDQARWQGELFALDLTQRLPLERAIPLAETAVQTAGRAVNEIQRIIPTIERAVIVLENAPDLISSEREAALKEFSTELTRSLAFLHEEMTTVLKQVTSERIAAVQDLHNTVVDERKAFARDIDEMSLRVVDHAFVRAAQLCAVVLVILFIGAVLLLYLVRHLFPTPRS
jgi:hypothetical protein